MTLKQEDKNCNIPQLMTIRQFVSANPAFTLGGIRNYIFFEEVNGLKTSGAIQRIGKKILINVDKFFDWVATCPSTTGGANGR